MCVELDELVEDSENIPDDLFENLIYDADEEFKSLTNEALRIRNDVDREDQRLRLLFSERIYNFLCVYMFVVIFMVCLSALSLNYFQLSDSVLIALIATTAANVIGLFAIVVKHLFYKAKS